MDFLKKKKIRVVVISVLGGMVLNLLSAIFAKIILNGGTEWTLEMGDKLMYITSFFAVFYIVATAFICFRDMDKDEVFSAVKVMIICNIVYIVIEQLVQYLGVGYEIMMLLLIPFTVYSFALQILFKIFADISVWIAAIPTVLLPFVYLLAKKRKD